MTGPFSFNDCILAFKTDDFKIHVKQALNDGHFLKEIFNKYDISCEVEKCINSQVPIIIESKMKLYNEKMDHVIEDHSESLTKKLENHTNKIIDQIVNEPLHQKITNSHINAIDEKGDKIMNEIVENASKLLSLQKNTFNDEMDNIKNKVDNNLQYLNQTIENMVENIHGLKNKINILEQKLSCQKKKHNKKKFKVGFDFLAIVIGCCGLYSFLFKN